MTYNRTKYFNLIKSRASKYVRQTTLSESLDKILNHSVLLTESLSSITKKLGNIPYAIIGGHAVTIYGHSRTTSDVDLLVNPDDMDRVVTALGGESVSPLASPRPDRPILGVSCVTPESKVDLIWVDEPWADKALNSAVSSHYGRVISKPYLMLTKLWAGRGEQDDTDVIMTLRGMSDQEVKLAGKLVSKYLPSDIEDFEQMVAISKC